MLKIMHQLIVLNHIGFTTDTIVQVNHLIHRTRTPVFRFESHTVHILCCTFVLRWPSQQRLHLQLYSSSLTRKIQVHGLVLRSIITHVSSHVVSRSLTTVIYIYKGPLSKFQPGALHNLNPPHLFTMISCSAFFTRFWKEKQYKPRTTAAVMFNSLGSNVISFLCSKDFLSPSSPPLLHHCLRLSPILFSGYSLLIPVL